MARRPVKLAPVAPAPQEYVVIDDRVTPDARGELGGARMYERKGEDGEVRRFVKMTPRQAQWYIEHRAISLDLNQPTADAVESQRRRRGEAPPKGTTEEGRRTAPRKAEASRGSASQDVKPGDFSPRNE